MYSVSAEISLFFFVVAIDRFLRKVLVLLQRVSFCIVEEKTIRNCLFSFLHFDFEIRFLK